MGAKHSKQLGGGGGGDLDGGGGRKGRGMHGGENGPHSDSSSSPRPTPHIEPPYTGPWAEYQFIDIRVPVENDVKIGDVTMTSLGGGESLVQALEKVYAQGYSLVTFCRVPVGCAGLTQKRVFSAGKQILYQGVFCR